MINKGKSLLSVQLVAVFTLVCFLPAFAQLERVSRPLEPVKQVQRGKKVETKPAQLQAPSPKEIRTVAETALPVPKPVASSQKIDIKADSLDYNKAKGIAEAKGNVLISRGDQTLSAEYVILDVVKEVADAYGEVVLKRGDTEWRGPRLRYDFKNRVGDAAGMSYDTPPFKVTAESAQLGDGNTYILRRAWVTTCSNEMEHAHYKVYAGTVVITPEKDITGKNTVFYMGVVPVFYFPWWYKSLTEDTGWRIRLGYSSKVGAYALTSYRYPISSDVKGETHFDYRTKRGVGLGQDFLWSNKESYDGMISFYYINDQKPLDRDDDPETCGIEKERYRIKLRHQASLTDRDSLYMQAAYLSDTDILEDFFGHEYRQSRQPDNYAAWSHRGDGYYMDVLARARINDFYQQVNRLPEASFNVIRQVIGDTDLYYESKTTLSNLEKVWEKGSGNQDYSTFRADSSHMILYPVKTFGFLNLIPRAGYRATYYSVSRKEEVSTEVVQTTVTNEVIAPSGVTNFTMSYLTSTNEKTALIDGDAELRSRMEFGMEASFKAFKTWGFGETARRHVVEPYANLTLVPEPNVLPDQLYQFDDVDKLKEDYSILLGVRNKYQRKKGDMPFDLIDLDIYSVIKLKTEDGESAFSSINFNGRLQPTERLLFVFDGVYDVDESVLASLNSRVEYSRPLWWTIGCDLIHRREKSTLLSSDVTFLPNRSWCFNLFTRYEFEDSVLEEQGGYIQRNLDCMSLRFGASVTPGYETSRGTKLDDEWRAVFEFWIGAFPQFRLSGHHGWES